MYREPAGSLLPIQHPLQVLLMQKLELVSVCRQMQECKKGSVYVFGKCWDRHSFFEPDRHGTIVVDFHQHMCTELTCLGWDAMPAQQLDELIYERLSNLRHSCVGK